MFEIAYLDANGIDLIGLIGPFSTAESARTALYSLKTSSETYEGYELTHCIVLGVPDPKPVRYQILCDDSRLKGTWEGLSFSGKRTWFSEGAARYALKRLTKNVIKSKRRNRKLFYLEVVYWTQQEQERRYRFGRNGVFTRWRIGVLETGKWVFISGIRRI